MTLLVHHSRLNTSHCNKINAVGAVGKFPHESSDLYVAVQLNHLVQEMGRNREAYFLSQILITTLSIMLNVEVRVYRDCRL